MTGYGALQSDGWLSLALPADGTTFRTSITDVADSLSAAGRAVVTESGEVDAMITATAPMADGTDWLVVAALDGLTSQTGTRVDQVRQRVRAAADAASFARRTSIALKSRGYSRADVLRWDFEEVVSPHRTEWRVLESRRLPRAAAVVARRDALAASIWERAAAEASAHGHLDAARNAHIMASGVAMNVGNDAVFRCAVGPAADHIRAGARTAEFLRRPEVPRSISRLVPSQIAGAATGIGRWTLERRIDGRAPASLTPKLMETLIDVIATTFLALGNGVRNDVSGYAATIERALGSQAAPVVRRGVELDEVLAPIPRGFSHGDLWRENLVLASGQLVGIVDWVRAGDGRFPLGDLFHLMATERDLRGRHYGETVTSELLPWARGGGDERARSLCRRLGFEPSPEILEALVLAYWYERTVSELESYRDRRRNADWMEANLAVVAAMAAG